MNISEYFDKTTGIGVMSTADSNGNLTSAIYARPYFIDEGTVAFIMADRLTHKNLQSNPHAVYLFMESGEKYIGKRLYLTRTKEEQNSLLIDTICSRESCPMDEVYIKENTFIVYFKIDKVLPLIGVKE